MRGPDYNMEFRVVHPDGSINWVAARGAMTFSGSGQSAVMVGINMDIHTRKTAELALAESELQFHTLADSIPQMAWMADPQGYRFWYNRRWYEYTPAVRSNRWPASVGGPCTTRMKSPGSSSSGAALQPRSRPSRRSVG